MNSNSKIHKEKLLRGDPQEIIRLANVYSHLNNLPPVSESNFSEFLAGKPLYLGKQSQDQWGMSFEDARRCHYDVLRTQLLIKGIVYQINSLKKSIGIDINVIEAGGGTGILAIAAAIAGANVTLLEINSETLKRTQGFIEFLGLTDKVTVVFANARTYIPNQTIDLIICECLHTGLVFEPQLQILNHLSKFLSPSGKLLPEGVAIRFALANIDWKNSNEKHTEFRNIKRNILNQGEWSKNLRINFYEEIKKNITNIKYFIPMNSDFANSILIEMDVLVADKILLKSGEAEFLGHPHAFRLTRVLLPGTCTKVFGYLYPGMEFNYEVTPVASKLNKQINIDRVKDL